jgi:hypothetical protein
MAWREKVLMEFYWLLYWWNYIKRGYNNRKNVGKMCRIKLGRIFMIGGGMGGVY